MKTTQSTLSGGASVLASLGEDSRGGSRGRSPHRCTILVVLIFVATLARAATNDLSGLLQKGLFEEEANRNLDAATAAYQTLVLQFDKDRQIGATAIFRLGEVYRKQSKTNEAAAQYERIVRDFAEQTTLVTLSRQNLAGLRPPDNRSAWTPPQTSLYQMRDEIERYRQLIANYQALPETNRLDSLCVLFANDDVIGADCHEAALVRSSLKRLLRDAPTNHPAVVKLQVKLQPLEISIEAYGREKIGQLIPLVASLEEELQRREALEGSTLGTPASGNRDPDLAQLMKLSRAELIQVLPTLAPDQLLTKLLEQLNTAQTKQAELRHDLGPDHPDVKRLVAVEKTLHEQIDQRVAGILKALELRSSASGASKPTATVSTVLDEEESEIRRIQAMIRNSPDLINAPGSGGFTPLHSAADAGRLTVARFLLDNGANVNGKNGAGETPLTLAAASGHKAMIEFLLGRGADVNAQGKGNSTALHQAALHGFRAVAEVLLANEASVDSRTQGQETPLHFATAAGHSDLIEFLIRHGADVNATDDNKSTPLLLAAVRGHSLVVKTLIAGKASPNLQDKIGRTALSHAAEKKHLDVVKALLDAKADPNAGEHDLPLLAAVRARQFEIAEALLRADADPNRAGKSTRNLPPPNPGGFIGGVPGIRQSFGPHLPLQAAVADGNAAMVKLLLKFNADANAKEMSWNSPAQPLVVYALNNTEMLKAFLEGGADPDSKDRTDVALIASAAQFYPAAIEVLISHKANVNARDGSGYAPLHWAASRGDEESVQMLLKAKADVNAKNQSWTPLHAAAEGGRAKIVKLLLANNADVNVRNSNGQTPLDLAKAFAARQPASHPGLLPQPGGVPTRTLRQPAGAKSSATEEPDNLADLLRQHGALDDLPDFNSIRITRQGFAQPLIVFSKGPKLTNHFTLLETVMSFYAKSSSIVNNRVFTPLTELPFPDFGRLIIRRPSQKPGGKEQEIKVSLLDVSNAVDCAKDVPVEFGDVIEIPERVHVLNEFPKDPFETVKSGLSEVKSKSHLAQTLTTTLGSATNSTAAFHLKMAADAVAAAQQWACLQKTVQLVVGRETTSFTVDSWKEGFLNQTLTKTEARSELRSSSDLSRVKVTRKDARSGSPLVLTVDATDANDSLWLHDGDVIEVPDKP